VESCGKNEPVRSVERDVLLFVLAAAAGSADSWSYLGLGRAFVANMTGNTVLLGIAVFQNHGDLLHPAIGLGCYVAGAMIGSLLVGNLHPEAVWSKAISLTLMLESVLMAAAATGWIAIHLDANHSPDLLLQPNLLLGCIALAIGMQSSAMVELKIPGIVTTYITGTWTTLMSGLVRLARREQQQAPPRQKLEFEKRLLMQAGVLSVYFLSALLTGWLFLHMPIAVGALPASGVLFAAVYGTLRARSTSE
jgi:uncharacterized membrane protein YoaK (UPF0700 family)